MTANTASGHTFPWNMPHAQPRFSTYARLNRFGSTSTGGFSFKDETEAAFTT